MKINFDLESVLKRPGALGRLTELEWDGEDESFASDLIKDDAESVFSMSCDNGSLGGCSTCGMLAWLGMFFWESDFADGIEGPYGSVSELRDAQSPHLEAEILASGDPDRIIHLEYAIWSGLDEVMEIASKLILPGMKIKVNNTFYMLTNNGLEECPE